MATAAAKAEPQSTELIVLDKLTPAAIFAPGGVDDILAKIAREVRSQPTDISTKAGREAVASLAYKVARSKTALDKMGKDLGDANYKAWKAVTAERARIEKELDDLRDEVRKPLTDWENAEKDRIAGHEAALIAIQDLLVFGDIHPPAWQIKERIIQLSELPERQWQEFAKRAADFMAQALSTLQGYLNDAEKREAEAAELARLRAEEITRQQKERDDRIAAEAAERARVEAEAKAKREADEAAAKAETERLRVEREKADAIARAEKAEADRKAAAAKAEQDRIDGHERALRSIAGMIRDACSPFNGSELIKHISGLIDSMEEMKRDWEEFSDQFIAMVASGKQQIADRLAEACSHEAKRSERAAKEAAEAAEKRQAAAIEAERRRVADEAATAAAETAKRNADTAHKSKINTEVLAALVAIGLDPVLGKAVITAIVKGKIPHTKIGY